MSNKPKPKRLSPEWHARDCEATAKHAKERSRTARVDVSKEFHEQLVEVHRDRAAKLRRLAELEARFILVELVLDSRAPADDKLAQIEALFKSATPSPETNNEKR